MGEIVRRVMARYGTLQQSVYRYDRSSGHGGGRVVPSRPQKTSDFGTVMSDLAVTVSDLGKASRKVIDSHAVRQSKEDR